MAGRKIEHTPYVVKTFVPAGRGNSATPLRDSRHSRKTYDGRAQLHPGQCCFAGLRNKQIPGAARCAHQLIRRSHIQTPADPHLSGNLINKQ